MIPKIRVGITLTISKDPFYQFCSLQSQNMKRVNGILETEVRITIMLSKEPTTNARWGLLLVT